MKNEDRETIILCVIAMFFSIMSIVVSALNYLIFY